MVASDDPSFGVPHPEHPSLFEPAPPPTAIELALDGRAAASATELASTPRYLAYLMGPAALAAILALMHFGLIAREPIWLWVGVFLTIPTVNLVIDVVYERHPAPITLHARLAVQAASVTAVIYLTGWGPVLPWAFAILALQNVAQVGSEVWSTVAFWSLTGVAFGQVAIVNGWMPSTLTLTQANTLALMGAFVVFFIIRMAGATMKQKEDAESSTRLSEDRFRSLIQHSSDMTVVIDGHGHYIYVSPAARVLLGYEPEEVLGLFATDLVHPDDRPHVADRLGPDFQTSRDTVLLQFRMEQRDGIWRDVEAVITNQLARPSVGGYVANVRDITERKEFEALLAHRALHDPLTGLANRQLILDRAEQMLVRSRRLGIPVAAYFIDLDNFKDANDTLGHEAGDRLLQSVAARFTGLLRDSDTVGRMGGDEFVILTEGGSLVEGPMTVAQHIREALRTPFQVEGYEGVPITVGASIGIAAGDRESAQELLRDADIALYRAKASGRDCCVLFESSMQSAALDRLELRSDLDAALGNDQFFLLYQPIFGLDSKHIRGVEALLRWRHPVRGVIGPDDFIPILEDSGMIVEVGNWVLRQACDQAERWRADGHRLTMSVNVSMRQLEVDGLVDEVEQALAGTGLEPASLILEVTESTLMRDVDATVSRLRKLKELGVLIAIDDFGTGFSSMSYLRQFPVDVLKIDRSFVSEMDGSPDSAALVHTLVELGRTLGLETLAEGIEEHAQLEALREEQCDSGQGFIFSRPVEPDAVSELLAAQLFGHGSTAVRSNGTGS